jgi:hypothetical protein
MQARSEAVSERLVRWGADDHPMPYHAEQKFHLPVQCRQAGRHPMVARSRPWPTGNSPWRIRHPAKAWGRVVSIS